MELSEQSIHDVIHPTAAFSDHGSYQATSSQSTRPHKLDWEKSWLNPKNRIDSLEYPRSPLWEIDGSTAFGSQFYVTPLFLPGMAPLRVDLFVPEPSKLDRDLRDLLDIDVTFHTRDKSRISTLGITRHLVRILHNWISTMDEPQLLYQDLPFGSKIVLRNLPLNVTNADIIIAPNHSLERQLLSAKTLQKFWGEDVCLPPTIDISEVVYVRQLHDSVCLVNANGKVWIFKGLTSYPKYLYHELRQLLRMPPHANVVARPVHLVTKKCSFGNKTAVVGFTLEYHVHGSLRDLVPWMQIHQKIPTSEKTKWAVQLSSALVHLRETSNIFYPDLRLDNIVLSKARDIVMIDFEQRGVWCEFAAPEVNAIEYMRLLAVDDDIPEEIQDRYIELLSRLLPDWETMGAGEEYRWPSSGYNVPWSCLTPIEQEACEVYMLGRVLWCIFEARSAPQRAAAWLSYRFEPIVEFPEYTTTPKLVKDLIDRCTRGRKPSLTKYIVRERSQLVLRHLEHTGLSKPEDVHAVARKWWSEEINSCEQWLLDRVQGMESGMWNENFYDRPSLQEVHSELKAIYEQGLF